jgi:hypothetical protein
MLNRIVCNCTQKVIFACIVVTTLLPAAVRVAFAGERVMNKYYLVIRSSAIVPCLLCVSYGLR